MQSRTSKPYHRRNTPFLKHAFSAFNIAIDERVEALSLLAVKGVNMNALGTDTWWILCRCHSDMGVFFAVVTCRSPLRNSKIMTSNRKKQVSFQILPLYRPERGVVSSLFSYEISYGRADMLLFTFFIISHAPLLIFQVHEVVEIALEAPKRPTSKLYPYDETRDAPPNAAFTRAIRRVREPIEDVSRAFWLQAFCVQSS